MRTISILSFLLITSFISMSFAATEIEIKGVKVGIDATDYYNIVNYSKKFTVAGVNGKDADTSTSVTFDNDKLDEFYFFFEPNDFNHVLNALKNKYPTIKCTNSKVINAFGASFNNIDCDLKDKTSYLSITKYMDINTSALSIQSLKSIAKKTMNQKNRNKDL